MKIKQTKALENALARGILASHQTGRGNPVDRAFITLLEDAGSYALTILGRFLKGWEIYQIKVKVERELDNGYAPGLSAADTNREMEGLATSLDIISSEMAGHPDATVNSGHLLLYLLRNKRFISSKVLELYNLPYDQVAAALAELPSDEDDFSQSKALRNIHIVHIAPQQPPRQEQQEYDQESGDEEDYDAEETTTARQAKKTPAGLEKYCTDLTKAARRGEIDPVVGREIEIGRLIQILGRRKKNNPVLIGEAGVGKSAIAEGLALRIASGEVPPQLQDKRLYSLDVASLVAGTKYRGQFEERIKKFMQELRKDKDAILFIDEIHTIVGAGSTQGSLDTANILKPALARGELQCIGATTLDEYRENIEKDGALERRFQKILVEPTSRQDTLTILKNIRERYEQHHCVRYSDEALEACVDLTDRYVTDRNFPDKAIDVLDEAGSKANLNYTREPDLLNELEEALRAATEEKRRAAASLEYDKAAKARAREVSLAEKLKELRADWRRQSSLNPKVIDADAVRDVVSIMTGIPLQNVSGDEKTRLKNMGSHLGSLVVGQARAIEKVTRSIQRSRAGLKDPNKPIGVFMFVGPTGVGKTLLAKELSRWMFGRGDALVRVDMSEYSEKHNVSRLIGSPPGYVGYNEGGQLTEIVRRQPYAVILFDEIEKAHPDVFNIMLQIFDEGQLTDGAGRKVDFRNTVIIMTSNVGSRRVASKAPVIGFGDHEVRAIQTVNEESDYRSALEGTFAPEFINRIDDVVMFNTLTPEQVGQIVGLEFGRIRERAAGMGYKLGMTPGAKKKLAALGYDSRYGVRSLKRMLLEAVEEPLAEMIVGGEIAEGDEINATLSGGRVVLKKKEHAMCAASA